MTKEKRLEREIVEMSNCIRELLKGGEHSGDCDNEVYLDNGEIIHDGECRIHVETAESRKISAKALLARLESEELI